MIFAFVQGSFVLELCYFFEEVNRYTGKGDTEF